jgi:uncharacterized protein YukE
LKFIIDTNEISKTSNEIKNIVSLLENNMQNIERMVLNLGLEWQGKAELSYVAKIIYLKKQFFMMCEFINEYIEILELLVSEMEQIEIEIQNQMEG